MHQRYWTPILLLGLPVPSVAIAQAKPSRAYSATELSLIANLSFQSAAKEASLKRLYDARLDRLDGELKQRGLRIRQLERSSGANQGELAGLQAQLTSAKQQFLDELAAKDRDFARERVALTNAATDLLQTPEGRAALQFYLSGAPGSAERAFAVLDKITAKRTAADDRATAALALDAVDTGRVPLFVAVRRFEKVVAADTETFWDWIDLTRLYQRTQQLDRAGAAAARAVATAQDIRDRAVALSESGNILKGRRNMTEALARYEESLIIRRALAAKNANSAQAQHDVFVGLFNVGDVLWEQGDLTGALTRYEEGLVNARARAAKNSSSLVAQQDVSVSLNRIGVIHEFRQDLAGALARYDEALVIDRALAAKDPRSLVLQRNVSVALIWVGRILEARQDLVGALARYEESLVIARALAAKDTSSPEAQRDVSVSLNRVADILKERRNLPGALARYDESLTIRRALAAKKASPAQTQRDVSINLFLIGEVLREGQDLRGAQTRYEEGLTIARSLAAEDVSWALVQHDILLFLTKLAATGAPGHPWASVLAQVDAMERRGQIMPADRRLVQTVRAAAAAAAAKAQESR